MYDKLLTALLFTSMGVSAVSMALVKDKNDQIQRLLVANEKLQNWGNVMARLINEHREAGGDLIVSDEMAATMSAYLIFSASDMA